MFQFWVSLKGTFTELNDFLEDMKGLVVRCFKYVDEDVNSTYNIFDRALNPIREPYYRQFLMPFHEVYPDLCLCYKLSRSVDNMQIVTNAFMVLLRFFLHALIYWFYPVSAVLTND